jgi:very-short-patch-repair endonuclease
VEEAQVLRLVTRDELRPDLRGTDEPRFTRSEAERRLVTLVRSARLPVPSTNTRVAGLEVDALWPSHRLIVEVDGFAYHGNRAAFERDRRRDAALTAAGYRVVRVTWRQLTDEPHAVVALLARLLPP